MGAGGTSSVNIEALEGAAARVDVLAGNFEAELASLGSLVQETANYMQNGPQESFEAKYQQFKGTMDNFIGALNEYSKAMKQYAQDQRNIIDIGTKRFESI